MNCTFLPVRHGQSMDRLPFCRYHKKMPGLKKVPERPEDPERLNKRHVMGICTGLSLLLLTPFHFFVKTL